MYDTETTIAKWNCAQVGVKFMRHLDKFEYQEMADMMAPDGEWIRLDGTVIKGKDGLLEAMSKRSENIFVRHLVTNTEVEMTSSETAHCIFYVSVYRHDFPNELEDVAPLENIELIAIYHEELTLLEGEWKIQKKYLEPSIFKRQKK